VKNRGILSVAAFHRRKLMSTGVAKKCESPLV